MKILLRAASLGIVLAAGTAAPAALAQVAPPAADTMFRATTLNLAAYGEAKIAPDMATITLGVQTEAPTAAAAMQANAEQMDRVMAALRRAGLAEADIQTSNLNLSPRYRHQENEAPAITGYQASNTVTITVDDLARLGRTVDAVVNAGANQIHGISFGLDDPTAARNAARAEAVRSLQAQAELYAKLTGHRVQRLVTLSEGAASAPPGPMPMMEMTSFRGAKVADTSISPGELTVRVDVTGLYELTR